MKVSEEQIRKEKINGLATKEMIKRSILQDRNGRNVR
jgi:hypothetical protein